MTEKEGLVLKNYNGYYYVASGGEIHTCKVKGKMKLKSFLPVTGDRVRFEAEGREGMITGVMERKNLLRRPVIANLDLLIATFACASPDFTPLVADKLLVLAAMEKINAVIVLNKTDLAEGNVLQKIRETYENAGYEVYPVSARKGEGIDALTRRVKGRVCAFGGPSGAGKSSLVNAIDPSYLLVTGSVSEKIGRGKHTTRYAQLLPFAGGYLADTPGFGNLILEDLDENKLAGCFPEFAGYKDKCRYATCRHLREPGCGIKAAVREGKIAESRYRSYLEILDEIREFNGNGV